VLEAQATPRLEIALQVARVDATVEVRDTPVLLEESPSVASNITRDQIITLPLNERDFNQLVLLAAGAVENIGSGNGRDFGGVALKGSRTFSNDYLLDGMPNNDVDQGRSAIPVSVDLIRESPAWFHKPITARQARRSPSFHARAPTDITAMRSSTSAAPRCRHAIRSTQAQQNILRHELRRKPPAGNADTRRDRADGRVLG
jgi:hypothetical protein